jgi:ubiquinone/menaquinone biosynthesis C-methylase UbiE
VSAFVPVDFYDYRPADLQLSNLNSLKGDLLNLPFESESIDSLSCMHTIEHIGLGRYGDTIDPEADLKAMAELRRVMTKNGSLIFVTPIGKEAKIEFNAHRIYTYDQILSYFPDFMLKEFSLIPEHPEGGGIIINANPAITKTENYACGCFWFIKK